MYVNAPTGKSKEDLKTLLFDRIVRRNRTNPYDEQKYSGAGLREVQTWWKTCKEWMTCYKTHSEPFIYDIKKLLKALSDKEAAAQSEVMHSWRIAQRGSRLERVRTNSSVLDDLQPSSFVFLLVCPTLNLVCRHSGRYEGGALSFTLLFYFHNTVGCSSHGE